MRAQLFVTLLALLPWLCAVHERATAAGEPPPLDALSLTGRSLGLRSSSANRNEDLLPVAKSLCKSTVMPSPLACTGGLRTGIGGGAGRHAAEEAALAGDAVGALAACCAAEGLGALAAAVEGLDARQESPLELTLHRLTAPLVAAFFPRWGLFSSTVLP